MEIVKFQIHRIPVTLWKTTSKKAALYLHEQGRNKEKAEVFANMANTKKKQIRLAHGTLYRNYPQL